MSDQNLFADVSRAARAQELLENELLIEVFQKLDSDYLAAWRETGVRDTDARERLWQAMQLLGKVQSHLQAIVSNGALARREIDDMARLGARPKYPAV